MRLILKDGWVYVGQGFVREDIVVEHNRIASIGKAEAVLGDQVLDVSGKHIFPGFVEAHAHFREPGFSYKGTIFSESSAAARGGYTDVFVMPNVNPVPDCRKNLAPLLDRIRETAVINVHPLGAITAGLKGKALAWMEEMAGDVPAFTDDGRGVQDEETMRLAMKEAARLGKIIAAHCEDDVLRRSGVIHDGAYARAHGFAGISSESEWRQIQRDVALARETGCAYHALHVSTREGVEIIREAKAQGLDVTCETAPHYLLLNDEMLKDEGRFKMNPPIRGEADRLALLQGVADGTVDMIATDHAPHSEAEKCGGLRESIMGVVGLETAFPLMYTYLVRENRITMERLIALMCKNPARRYGISSGIAPGAPSNLTVFDLNREYRIDPGRFLSLGKATPFAGWKVWGRCVLTICNGKIAYWGD